MNLKPIRSLIILAVASLGLAGTLSALPAKITVHGGDGDQDNAILSFEAPKDWDREALLVGPSGVQTYLQIDDSGHATMIVPHIAKGESLTFSPVKYEAIAEKAITTEKAGSVLKFTHRASGKVQPMLDYQMTPGDVPAGVSEVFKHGAHLHPVYSPSGRLVTGNHPEDHRWHRGIWMAWTHTEFEGQTPDFWNQGKGEGKDKSAPEVLAEIRFDALVKTWSGQVHGGFVSKHRFIDYNSGAAKDVLNETWEVTAYAAGDAYVIDFISTQTCAGTSPVKLPKYHYGGLGVRGNLLWNAVDAVKMLTSNGDDRKKGDATKAKWVHLGGDVEGQPTGMAVLIHPSNYRFPQPLRLNPKNPQLCIAPSQDGDWSIEPGTPYVSKYRIIVSDGAAAFARLEAAWQSYAAPLRVTFE